MQAPISTHAAEEQTVEQIKAARARIQTELAKVIVGQKDVIEQLLIALFAGVSREQARAVLEHAARSALAAA